MEKKTFEEVIDKLKEVCDTVYNFAFDEVPILEDEEGKYVVEVIDGEEYNVIEGVGPYKEIKQYGGEGEGDTWYSIKYFPLLDMYIKVDGWYQSYHGTEFEGWDSCSEVRPIEKVVTVYE